MTRLIFPDEGSRSVYHLGNGGYMASSAGLSAVLYTNAAATVLADVRVYDGTQTPGAAYAGSSVPVDEFSRLPVFWGPDAVDTLYAVVGGGAPTPVYARTDDRIDANAAAIAALQDPVIAVTYNADLTVASVTEAGITTTFTYNADLTVATQTRLGVTRTYTYTAGNLTGVS